ncbi:hypothetical protein MIND_00645500 [Mycena indigotica]|uniref:Uncharacterized protein n=1 Tax=Mycena indigotica TaxID=2126181 RepID=A0A8H6W3D6_9AGAR|nr:uncharacterized protein MIND_00645500 [Mycena indigotica]KAF7304139.1 hypothetical protein MIND_00645500 [Mycena indigotica]
MANGMTPTTGGTIEPRYVFFTPPGLAPLQQAQYHAQQQGLGLAMAGSPLETQRIAAQAAMRRGMTTWKVTTTNGNGGGGALPTMTTTSITPTLPLPPTTEKGKAKEKAKAAVVAQPLLATGDWEKDLVQLAKTAELKKHALTLQLHTAHILSAHAAIDQKSRAVEDVKEQKNRLESERKRLIDLLAQINDDRTAADLLETSLERERTQLRNKITELEEGEYKEARGEVERLRKDLGQPPLPSLREMVEGLGSEYLEQRRAAGPSAGPAPPAANTGPGEAAAPVVKKRKRAPASAPSGAAGAATSGEPAPVKRPRGRPRKSAPAVPPPPSGHGAQGVPVGGTVMV